nr:hypothetical protein BaRGS_025545 [Batillaria attramentaria]
MGRLVSAFCFLLGISASVGFLDETADFSHNNNLLIYHDHSDLLLTMYMDVCYFTPVSPEEEKVVENVNLREQLENTVFTAIVQRTNIVKSDLDHERDKYQDLLASYHCADKDIYDLNINLCRLIVQPVEDPDEIKLVLFIIWSVSANFTHNVQITYHDYSDLLLTIQDNRICYSTRVERQEKTVVENHWTLVESLSYVRNEYKDLLADFHCAGKDICDLNLDHFPGQ